MPSPGGSYSLILDALDCHAESQGDKTAFTFLKSDDVRLTISYLELQRRAKIIARNLLSKAEPRDRAMLMYSAGLGFIEAFLACLYAGIIAVPAYPPKINRKAERLHSIARNCGPSLILCDIEAKQDVNGCFTESYPCTSLVVTDEIESSSNCNLPDISSDQLAFLQYTSGSTAAPKGVMVSHRNIVSNEKAIQEAFSHNKNSIGCGWLPVFHDMGLIGIVLQSLFVGMHTVIMSPIRFLSKPIRWLEAIDEFRVSTSGGPNFSYDHCLNIIEDSNCQHLDLSCWNIAFNGAEPVRDITIKRFVDKFSKFGFSEAAFLPCYGLAEATLFVSGGPHWKSPKRSTHPVSRNKLKNKCINNKKIISCGEVGNNIEVRIVCPKRLDLLNQPEEGEIWLRGQSVALGYWNCELTGDDFMAYYNGQDDDSPYFRTGDLGFVYENELFVTGRIKELIIIHGRNIYPQDIELIVEKCLNSRSTNSVAAFSISVDGEEHLCLVIELPKTLSRSVFGRNTKADMPEELSAFFSNIRHEVVAALNIQADYFGIVPFGKFPRTSSGKTQRHKCKYAIEQGDLRLIKYPNCDQMPRSNPSV